MLDAATERKKLKYSLPLTPQSYLIFWPCIAPQTVACTNPQSFNEIKREADKYAHGHIVLIRYPSEGHFIGTRTVTARNRNIE